MEPTPEIRPRLRVLLIEDDEDDYVIVRELLEQFRESIPEIEWISNPDRGLEITAEQRHDVILVDYRLGRWSGLELIEKISETGTAAPLILLTGEGRDNLDIEALQIGAADYLAKAEINARLLERSIRYAIERKRSEEALRESEKRFRKLADAVPVLIWMNSGDPDDNTFLNQCWLDFRGRTAEQELPNGWMQGVHPDDLDRLLKIARDAMSRQEPFEMEFRLLRRDGEYRWMLNTGTCIRLTNGPVTGYVGTCVDITDRKISAEQLAHARDEALEHARLKSQFLANMTHEIRTPMNGILGMTSLLQQTDLTDEQRDLAESVHSSGQALVRIIDDILDFSRLEAGKLTIDHLPFNLLTVMEEVLEQLAESARLRNIELIASIAPGTPLALIGDPGRLRQVLLNLAGNAIKFTHEGEVILNIRLLRIEAEKISIRITISDTGIGMSTETQEKLFTPFMQADGSTTRTYGGTGLGLAICKEIIDLMNGHITVTSEPGHGTTVDVRLDFNPDPEGESFHEHAKPEWRNRKILVIDDNEQLRNFLCRYLNSLGFDCSELQHPWNAPDILAHAATSGTPFAALFVDADQGTTEAKKILTHLNRFPGREQTTIVAMPFDALNEELKPLRAAGADFFLPKPIRQSQIYPLLKSLFNQSGKSNPDTPPNEPAALLENHRFLIVTSKEPASKPLKHLLELLGDRANIATTAEQALQSMTLFHYDAVFLDQQLIPESRDRLIQRIQTDSTGDGHRNVPVIGFGSKDWRATGRFLSEPFQAADLIEILQECRLLPEPPPQASAPILNTPPKTTPPTAPTLDPARLREILSLQSNSRRVLTDLLNLFQEEVPRKMDDLRKAVENNSESEINFLLHSMAGICGNLGAARMTVLCEHLKTALSAKEDLLVTGLLNAIEKEITKVEKALRKIQKT